MKTEREYIKDEEALRKAGWAYLGAGEWNDPVANVTLLTSTAYEVMVQRAKQKPTPKRITKVKVCPKCGSKRLGERWCKGRMLQQHCKGEDDEYCNDDCSWIGQPYTPPRRRITNTDTVRLDGFFGWHYIVYDKYGHVEIDSATYDTRAEAVKEMVEDIIPKQGYDDPSAPHTAVLFNVPSHVTIKGTMYRFSNGMVNKVIPKVKKK